MGEAAVTPFVYLTPLLNPLLLKWQPMLLVAGKTMSWHDCHIVGKENPKLALGGTWALL